MSTARATVPVAAPAPAVCCLCGGSDVRVFLPASALADRVPVLRCAGCDLVFLGGGIRGERRYWDSSVQEQVYGDPEVSRQTEVEFRKGLAMLQGVPSGGRLLDFGCGTGQFLKVARDRGWEVYGLDISPGAAQLAADWYGITVAVGDVADAPYPGAFFDAVTMWDVIEHLVEPVRVLTELHRRMKPGALLVIKTPNEDSLFKLMARAAYHGSAGRFPTLLKYVYYVPHYFSFSPQTLAAMLGRTGFEVVAWHLEETELTFARKKIQAHYRTWERALVAWGVPAASVLARLLRRQNKIAMVARKTPAATGARP